MVSNIEVREALVNYYIDLQAEQLRYGQEISGYKHSKEEVRKSTEVLIRAIFENVSADFDHPTKQDILKVCDVLKRREKLAGTDEEIIKKHIDCVIEMLDQM